MKKLILLTLLVLVAGCAEVKISIAIDRYQKVAPQISLGDAKEDVLAILMPAGRGLSPRLKKMPDTYMNDGSLIEILYFRSGLQSDGLTTDDEFTPYIFVDGQLVAIGWGVLGGPRTRGRVVRRQNITTRRQNRHYNAQTELHRLNQLDKMSRGGLP